MSSRDLWLLNQLANVDFIQFTVTVVGRVATEGPNLAPGLQSSLISILYSYIKPTLLLPPVILLPVRKKLPKIGHILYVRNLHTHTMIASE